MEKIATESPAPSPPRADEEGGWHERFVSYLTSDFRKRRETEPELSLRSFAKKIGLSPGPVSEMMNGKLGWSLSKSRAREIVETFLISKGQKNRLLSEMGLELDREKRSLSEADHALLSDYLRVVLIASASLAPQFSSVLSLADRFGLQVADLEKALEPLLKHGVLRVSADGVLSPVTDILEFSDGVPRPDIRKFHQVSLSKMLSAIFEIEVAKRDISTILFAGSKKRIEYLREEVRKLQDRASSIMFDDDEGPDTVYQFSAQICPVDTHVFQSSNSETHQ